MEKKRILMGIGVTIGILLMISGSYAWWIITREQIGMNKLSTSCFELSLTNEKNEINLQNAYPIIDEEGKNLTPYSFTIKNTCDLFASFTISLELLEGSTLPSKYVAVMLNSEEIETLDQKERVEPIQKTSVERRVLGTGSLGSEDEEDYTLRIWLDEDVTMENKDAMNALLKGKIIIEGSPSTYSPVEQGITKLKDAILANEYQTTPEVAKEKISKKQTPDFSKTAPVIDWQENHGTSLITTSSNTNNYIGRSYNFNKETGYYELLDYGTTNDYKYYTDISNEEYGKGDYYTCVGMQSVNDQGNIYYWRPTACTTMYKIVSAESYEENGETKYRIEGYQYDQVELESDKSDKGLYETKDDQGVSYYYRGSVKNNNVSFGGFNWQIIRINGDGSIRMIYNGKTTELNSSKSIGRSAFNEQANSPAYVGYMHGNTINVSYEENTKNEVDSTMKTTLDDWYEKNIVEQNLSSYIADAGFCNDRSLVSGDGVSLNANTNYRSHKRNIQDHNPSNKCPNVERDLFTTNISLIGNKALTYPIGLITADEAMYAGYVYGKINRMNYLHFDLAFWTISPIALQNSQARNFYLTKEGKFEFGNVNSYNHALPVINLSSEVEITGGIGTSNDPFVVKTT